MGYGILNIQKSVFRESFKNSNVMIEHFPKTDMY